MLKKVIKYENPFTGQEVSEEHYFHISKADLVEMEMEEHKTIYTSKSGEKLTGMQAKLQQIADSEDGKVIMTTFKDIIRRAYGKKEGDRFLKSPAIWEEFSSSEAFSQLIFEVCTDAKASAEFVNGIVPNNLEQVAKEVREQAEKNGDSNVMAAVEDAVEDVRSEEIKNATSENPITLTRNEVIAMSDEDFRSGFAEGRYKLS